MNNSMAATDNPANIFSAMERITKDLIEMGCLASQVKASLKGDEPPNVKAESLKQVGVPGLLSMLQDVHQSIRTIKADIAESSDILGTRGRD